MRSQFAYICISILSCLTLSHGGATVHIIAVGNVNGTLSYTPDIITGAVGDMVQFQFNPANHSVTQGDFDTPCQPSTLGFFSGFMPVTSSSTIVISTQTSQSAVNWADFGFQVPTYTIQLNDTDPIYYYCSQGKHCEAGMVGGINVPTTGNTLAKYAAAAAAIDTSTIVPTVGESKTGASTTISDTLQSFTFSQTSSSSSSTTESTKSSSSTTGSSKSSSTGTADSTTTAQVTATSMSGGVIAGIILGTLAVLLGAVGLWIFWKRTTLLSGQKTQGGSIRFLGPAELEGDKRDQAKELEVKERPLELETGRSLRRPIYELPGR